MMLAGDEVGMDGRTFTLWLSGISDGISGLGISDGIGGLGISDGIGGLGMVCLKSC